MCKAIALFVSLLIVGAGVLNAQRPASAAGEFALYDNSNGTGFMEGGTTSAYLLNRCYSVASLDNNRTSYIVNSTGSYFYVFDNGSCSSTPGTIYPNSRGAMSGVWNNSISSFYRAT